MPWSAGMFSAGGTASGATVGCLDVLVGLAAEEFWGDFEAGGGSARSEEIAGAGGGPPAGEAVAESDGLTARGGTEEKYEGTVVSVSPADGRDDSGGA